MAIDLSLLKEHPYATGGIIIVGGVIVFYLLSSGNSSSGTTGSSNNSAYLNAEGQLAQVQAGTSQAQIAANAQTQQSNDALQAQLDADQTTLQATQTQTAAQLAATLAGISGNTTVTELNDQASTVQSANQYLFEQNTTEMQDAVLQDQINSGVLENANNNATALAGEVVGAGVTDTAVGDALTLAQQQELDNYNLTSESNAAYDAEIPTIVQKAGNAQNSIIDATDQTGIFQTILSKGNPSVAAAASAGSTSEGSVATNASVAKTASITGALTSIAQGLLG